MPTAIETVDSFIALICERDVAGACSLLAEDVIYDNVPMAAVEGRDAARSLLEPLVVNAESVDWVVHHQVGDVGVVLNERTDRFLVQGRWIEIPVAGVFEVSDGEITLWRDYFDLAGFTAQVSPPHDTPA